MKILSKWFLSYSSWKSVGFSKYLAQLWSQDIVFCNAVKVKIEVWVAFNGKLRIEENFLGFDRMKISEFSFLSNSILDLKYKETEFSWIQVNSIEFSFKIKRVIFSPCMFCCQQCLWLISLIQSRFKNYCCLGKIFCSNGKRYKKCWVMGIECLRISGK